MKTIINFFKREVVFTVATVLAIASMFIIHPTKEYLGYIDFRTLALLLALMLVVSGLSSCGLFDILVKKLIIKVNNRRQLALTMVLLCFFTSMLITNDVALITFVPFTLILLDYIRDKQYSVYLIVLETIAANLGSMFTPIGNPQNLYLFSLSGMDIIAFIKLMLPYTFASFVLLILAIMIIKPKAIDKEDNLAEVNSVLNYKPLLVYITLFVVCIFTVLSILDYRIMLCIVLVLVALVNIKLIPKADYVLLLTFIAFFIFIGNIKNIPQVNQLLENLVQGRECYISVAASQVVSNVPAAMLLSGFTKNFSQLIIGTNIGGLGTLIASMASLISFKFYNKTKESNSIEYMLTFTLLNILFLVALLILYALIH